MHSVTTELQVDKLTGTTTKMAAIILYWGKIGLSNGNRVSHQPLRALGAKCFAQRNVVKEGDRTIGYIAFFVSVHLRSQRALRQSFVVMQFSLDSAYQGASATSFVMSFLLRAPLPGFAPQGI